MVKPHEIFVNKSRPKIVKTKFRKEDDTEIEIEWKIKPLSPRLMAKNYKYFAALQGQDLTEEDAKDMSQERQIDMMESLAPLLDIVLPYCCIEPKVVFEGNTTPQQINIDDIDLQTLMSLFEEIFKSTGLTDEGDKERKNLSKVPSVKVSPPSV